MQSRRAFLRDMAFGATVLACSSFLRPGGAQEASRPNILFIAVDDLRPQMHCYGHHAMITPHLDRLAAFGTLFERAYCQVAVCGASRASLLSGLRPHADRFKTARDRVTKQAPGITSLPLYLRQNGYHTISNGKMYHHADDDMPAWSEEPYRDGNEHRWLRPENIEIHQHNQQRTNGTGPNSRGPAYEWADVPDEHYPDDTMTTKSIADLTRLKANNQPFFLATGFVRPHLPFNAPTRFWELYKREKITIPDNYFPPEGAPAVALHNFGELRAYHDIPATGPVSDETALHLIHGYYASTSFVDYQIGRLLEALTGLDLSENTVVLLAGDQGWQLGEHALWCKHSTFETSTHVPLLICAPGLRKNNRSRALVEFVDIYPTLCELVGLPVPVHVQGTSVVPLMRDPDLPWKPAAFSRWLNGWSIRTERYRYTEWRNDKGEITARMLYDHGNDPGENVNIAEAADKRELTARLSYMLQKGWQAYQ